MRELGKASARARSRPNAERVHPSLRDFLKREVPPSEVWQALKLALEGGSESARVSAARVLIDALHEQADDRSRELQVKTAADEFRANFGARLERMRALGLVVDDDELRELREKAARWDQLPNAIKQEHTAA